MIQYRLANHSDNQQLVKLTALSGMPGETSLRIDRRPDFFGLLAMRGDTKVFIALDGETIVGSLCVSLQQVYVGREIVPMRYIGDFKVAAPFRNKGIGLQLCNMMADYVISRDADLAFLNVSKGNTKPVSFFKNRPGVPDFDNIGVFKIYQFIGRKKMKGYHPYKIEETGPNGEIAGFLNAYYKGYELGPVITHDTLAGSQIFRISEDGKIKAVMCLADTMGVKQNVVIKLSWAMKCLLKLINGLAGVFSLSGMPVINEPVRMLYIKYLAVNNNDKNLVKVMVSHARDIVYNMSYSFASIGLHEKDPLNNCLSGLFKLTFNSVGMLLSIKDNRALIEKVKKGIPFEDYSLV